MMMNENRKALLFAISKGYRCDCLGQVISPEERIVNGYIGNHGYLTIGIRLILDNGKTEKRPVAVHRLQAYQKYGDKIFEKGVLVRHRNNIKTDNKYDNILIGSYSDNYHDNSQEVKNNMISGGIKGSHFAKITNLKYDDDFIKNVGDFIYNGKNLVKDTVKKYNISSSSLTRILKKYREKYNPDVRSYNKFRRNSQKNNVTKYDKDLIDKIFSMKRSGIKKKDIMIEFNLTYSQLSYILYINKN